MLKSMMRANAVAAALFLGYAAYTFTNAPGERFLELPLDRFTIQSIQKETNIEVLRKHVLYLMEQNERRRKDDNDFRVAYRRIHTETLAALALFAALLFASTAWALRRELQNAKTAEVSSNAP